MGNTDVDFIMLTVIGLNLKAQNKKTHITTIYIIINTPSASCLYKAFN